MERRKIVEWKALLNTERKQGGLREGGAEGYECEVAVAWCMGLLYFGSENKQTGSDDD